MKTTHAKMTAQNSTSTVHRRKRLLPVLALGAALGMAGQSALADEWDDNYGLSAHSLLRFDTELTSFNLNGGPFEMPLASDPGNALGDSVEGFGFVRSQVSLTLSSQRGGPASTGKALALAVHPDHLFDFAYNDFILALHLPEDYPHFGPVDPAQLHGRETLLHSHFQVFFDIAVTDVDSRPGRDFAGQADGGSFSLLDNGPAHMESFSGLTDLPLFDKDAPNFGLLPPPGANPYLGHFQIEIPLGGDINANGINDKIKFSLVTHSVEEGSRTFIILPDGTVLDTFDSGAVLEGAVVDETTDPPFTIGMIDPLTGLPDASAFGGPVTASSRLTTPMVPEPSHAILAMIGGVAAMIRRRRAH